MEEIGCEPYKTVKIHRNELTGITGSHTGSNSLACSEHYHIGVPECNTPPAEGKSGPKHKRGPLGVPLPGPVDLVAHL